MRGQSLIAVFLTVIGVGMADLFIDSVALHLDNCLIELDDEGFERMIFNKGLDNKNFFRFKCCLWSEAGFIKNGKMDFRTLRGTMVPDESSNGRLGLFERIRKCRDESEVSNDSCMVLDKYFDCLIAQQKQ